MPAFSECASPSVADDAQIVGPPLRVVEAFHFFEHALLALGLRVQRAKCVAWNPSRPAAFGFFPKGCTSSAEGIRVLGAPLGTDKFISTFVRAALEEDSRGLDLLPRLGDPQVAFRLLTTLNALAT